MEELQKLLENEDVQKLINEKANEISKKSSTEIKRSLSERFKVNLFDDNEVNQWLASKVDKKDYDELNQKYSTDKEAYETKLKTYEDIEPKISEYESKITDLTIENILTKNSIEANKTIKDVIKLNMNENPDKSLDELVSNVVKELGIKSVRKAGFHINPLDTAKTGHESEMEKILASKKYKK